MFKKDEDYRKARKESKDRITKVIKVWSAREETLHDEGFQKGAEFGYNKANEWHYVKDGDLPEEDKSIMIYAKLADSVAVGKRRKQGKVYEWYFATYDGTFYLRDKEVIAWKEIVLPKESE